LQTSRDRHGGHRLIRAHGARRFDAAGIVCRRVGSQPNRLARVRATVVVSAALLAAIGVSGASSALGARSASPSWPYKVYRPANLSKSVRVPLVVLPTGNIQHSETTTNLDGAADHRGFEVVYAQIVKSYNDTA